MNDEPIQSREARLQTEAEAEFYRRQEVDGPVMDEEDAIRREIRDAARQQMAEFRERFVTPLIELRMLPTDCLIFANGYGHLIGCHSQQDIVRRHERAANAKANVSKYVKQFKRRIGLPALNGQRDESACESMREARNQQLKPKTKK
jgi:hypothetical protein